MSQDGRGNGSEPKGRSPTSPPIKKQRFTAAQVVNAAAQALGTVSQMARLLNCDVKTVRNYAKRYPTVAEAIKEQREGMVDNAELALAAAVLRGEAWAVCFTLKTQGKERGYVERVEHTGEGGLPFEVTFRIAASSSLSDMLAGDGEGPRLLEAGDGAEQA